MPSHEQARSQRIYLEGETDPPDVDRLLQALCCTDGTKLSSLLVSSWVSPYCYIIHHGSKNYFAEIQEYQCLYCLKKVNTHQICICMSFQSLFNSNYYLLCVFRILWHTSGH